MIAAFFLQDLEAVYDVSQREIATQMLCREKSSKERFHTQSRYGRGAKRQGPSNSAQRRRSRV